MTRILVADSDPHILLLCQAELREEGYDVLVATNGKDVLNLLDMECPDLVVLEMILPDMSGMETLQIIKGTCRNTRVIFHSTYGLPEAVVGFQCDGVVLKTHNLDCLKKVVQRFLPSLRPAENCRRPRLGKPLNGIRAGVRHGLNGN